MLSDVSESFPLVVFMCPESVPSFEEHLKIMVAQEKIFLVVADELHCYAIWYDSC